jgi:predicted anti-sigma-YlaC factor YlaD
MRCDRLVELAGAWLERRLGIPDRLAVRVHLARCPACRAYTRQLETTFLALRAMPSPPPVTPADELMARYRALHDLRRY